MRNFIRRLAPVAMLTVIAVLAFSTVAGAAQPTPNKRAVEGTRRAEPAAQGDRRWVVCNGSVAIGTSCYVRGVGALNASGQVTKIATGTYDIRFDIGILQCAYTATIGLTGNSGSSPPGEITVVGRAGTNNGVFLQTFDSAGTLADRSFHLLITC